MFPYKLFKNFTSLPKVLSDLIFRKIGINPGHWQSFINDIRAPVTLTNISSDDAPIRNAILSTGGYDQEHEFCAMMIVERVRFSDRNFRRGYNKGYFEGFNNGYSDGSKKFSLYGYRHIDEYSSDDSTEEFEYDPSRPDNYQYSVGFKKGAEIGYSIGKNMAYPYTGVVSSDEDYDDYGEDYQDLLERQRDERDRLRSMYEQEEDDERARRARARNARY